MARANVDDSLGFDRDDRDSILFMKRERSLKVVGVFAALVVGIAVLFGAAYLGYGSVFDVAKTLPVSVE